jgi:hypothetical protein
VLLSFHNDSLNTCAVYANGCETWDRETYVSGGTGNQKMGLRGMKTGIWKFRWIRSEFQNGKLSLTFE